MTNANIALHQGPDVFVRDVLDSPLEDIIARRNELLGLLNEGTDIPAMEETRQAIRAARKATSVIEARLKMAQSALWDWEHAIINRLYELSKEEVA